MLLVAVLVFVNVVDYATAINTQQQLQQQRQHQHLGEVKVDEEETTTTTTTQQTLAATTKETAGTTEQTKNVNDDKSTIEQINQILKKADERHKNQKDDKNKGKDQDNTKENDKPKQKNDDDKQQHQPPPHYKEIHLIMQYYTDKRPQRVKELQAALNMNLYNKHIDFIHLLLEKDDDFPHHLIPESRRTTLDKMTSNCNQFPKVVTHHLGHRLTFKDGIEYAQAHLSGKIVALMNADIFFDNTVNELHYVRDLHRTHTAYILSRYEHHMNGTVQSFFCTKSHPGYSADVFIWTPPLHCHTLTAVKQHLSYPLGTWGGENRWMFEMNKHCSLRIKNPCFTIITHHVHDSADPVEKSGTHLKNNPSLGGSLSSPPVALGPADYAQADRPVIKRVDTFNHTETGQITYTQMLHLPSATPKPTSSAAPTSADSATGVAGSGSSSKGTAAATGGATGVARP